MIKWQPFVFDNQCYDLSHLHPFRMEHRQSADGKGNPERRYQFEVCFSLHCFTKTYLGSENANLLYGDNREMREFCFERYALSKNLPEIIQNIFDKNCYHTGHSNYFLVEFIDRQGTKTNYEVYFSVSRHQKGLLNLFIQSAYPRTKQPVSKNKKPIRFRVIAHNTLNNKPIKLPT